MKEFIKKFMKNSKNSFVCIAAGLLVSVTLNFFVCQTVEVSGSSMEPTFNDGKMTDNFISNRLKSKNILKITIKNRILYKLAPSGYKELSKFLSGQKMIEGIDASYLKWCDNDACNMVCRNSAHSSAVGIVFIHMASRCCFDVSDFQLNTPLDHHGNIRAGLFGQQINKLRSDAYLLLCHPCRQEFFFENDMGTERADAVVAKLERYFALIFSTERDLCGSCIHFTIGDYHTAKGFADLQVPSKYTLQVYRACAGVLFAAAGISKSMPVSPDRLVELINSVNGSSGTCRCDVLDEIKKYVSKINSACPDIKDVYSCFDRAHVLKMSSRREKMDCGYYHASSDIAYIKRREKIFEWCRNVPDMPMLVKRGLRITASDNCSDGTDFMLSYPNLRNGGVDFYMELIEKHIREFSYSGKFTDIQDDDLTIRQVFQGSLGGYDSIGFFQSGSTFYSFANCYSLHHGKGSFKYSFENISNDVSARMRIERYLDDGAPVIPFLQIFIAYSDDIYSLRYIESLKANYGILEHGQTNVCLAQLKCRD